MKAQNLRTTEEHTTSQDKPQVCAMSQERRTGSFWRLRGKPPNGERPSWCALRASHQRSHLNGEAGQGTHRPATSVNKQPRTRPRRPREKLEPEPKGPRRDKTGRNDTTKKGHDQGGASSWQKERGPAGAKTEDRARTGPVPCTRVTWVVYLLFRSDRHSRERHFPHIAAIAVVKRDIQCVVPDSASGTG